MKEKVKRDGDVAQLADGLFRVHEVLGLSSSTA